MKNFYVLRGCPGCGKSTLARKIVGMLEGMNPPMVRESLDGNVEGRYLSGVDGVIVSTDLYFLNDQGEYIFDGNKLVENHQRNFQMCRQLMEDEEPIVVLDNTNIKKWHFENYIRLALEMGYEIHIIELPMISAEEAFVRNRHNVPLQSIQMMIEGYERL